MVLLSLRRGREQTELRIQLPPPFSGEKPTALTRHSEPKLDYLHLFTILIGENL